MSVALEICVEGPAGARAARLGGADRVELCAALALGGVTPSAGIVAATLETGVPVHVMVRPGTGDFIVDRETVDAIAADIRAFMALGAAGVVVGALTPDGDLDRDAIARWRAAAGVGELTLHRAIDLARSPVEACGVAVELGVDRILTSGGAPRAPDGAATIAAMVGEAGEAVEIMAGSGITAANAGSLIAATGVAAIHASAGISVAWSDRRIADFGFGPSGERRTDPDAVRALGAVVRRNAHD